MVRPSSKTSAGRPVAGDRGGADAQQALRESEARFRATFEQAAVGMAHTTTEGRFLQVNGRLCAILGYAAPELCGLTTRDLTHPDDRDRQDALRLELMVGQRQSFSAEKRYVRKDGAAIWVNRTVTLAHRPTTGEPYLIQVIEDISERKRTEARLVRLTRARQVMASCNHILVHATDESAMLERMCRVVVESGGYKMAWVGLATGDPARSVRSAAHAGFGSELPMAGQAAWDADGRYRGFMSDVIAGGRPHIARDILTDPAYARRAVRAKQLGFQSSIALPLNGAGRVLGALALYAAEPDAFDDEELELLTELADDIAFGIAGLRERAARHEAEAARHESEQRFRYIFEQAAVGISRVDLDGVLVDVNQKFCDMLGYSKEALLGRHIRDVTHPDDFGKGAQYRAQLAHRAMQSASGEKRFVRNDGTVMWARRTMSTACDAAGRPLYVISVVEDITERKALEHHFELAFNQAAVGMTQTALDGRLLQVNEKYAQMLGYSREELSRIRVEELTHPEDRAETARQMEEMLAGKMASANSEKRLVCRDGRVLWVNRALSLVRDAAGDPLHFMALVEDITARKDADERYRATFDSAPVGILHTSVDGDRIIHANPRITAMLGYTHDELLRMASNDIIPREFRGEDQARYREGMLRGELPVFSSERKLLRKDGSTLWVNRTVSLARDAAGRPLYFIRIIEDITERMVSGRRRAMEHAVTKVLAESATVHEAMPLLIRTMCEATGWAYGAYWSWNETARTLMRSEFWSEFDLGLFGEDEVPWTRLRHSRPGGLIRRAWVEKQATWFADLRSEPSFNRRESAMKLGLHSAFSFPVISGNDTIGIMEFYGREPREPDDMLLQTSSSIGRQIGQFVQRKLAEEAQRSSEATLRAAFEQAGVGMAIRDIDPARPRWLRVNQKLCDILGYTREELLGLTSLDITPPDERGAASDYNEKMLRGEIRSYSREKRYTRKDGRALWTNVSLSAVSGPDGRPTHVISVIQDINDRKRAEAALRESEEQFKQLAGNIPQVFWITDTRLRKTIYLSPAASGMTGRPMEELYANPRALVRAVHPEDRRRVYLARKTAFREGYDETFRVIRPDGTVRWINDRAFPVHDGSGRAYRIAGIAEDVTDRKLAEERLLQLAHYDVLTSLPNRVLFHDRLHQALAQAKRNRWTGGVLVIDVDRFKNVNDTLGHAVGDKLLQQISGRLMGAVRTGDTVGRLGGDEFAIILSNLASAQDANLVAQKIMVGFKEPIELDSAEIYVTASIGITLFPSDSMNPDELIRNADTAMYRAKEVGRNSYQFYTPEMNARALEALSMENSLRRALERNEFILYYQPKASIQNGKIVGVEALLRWQHPERGLVSPGQFMPVLEETGLIVEVGEWVLRAVCAQIRDWERAGIAPPPVAVNLSGRQFNASDLGGAVRAILLESGVAPGLIELEITESSLMINTENAARTLEFLSDLGVGLSIDDFGTGYSSLSYLKRFPLDALKIDRSFVRDITSDSDDAAITRAVISMAHSLGLEVVAEGVETIEQLVLLAGDGCDQIQGYYFSRPLPADECAQWLAEDRRLPRTL